MASAWPDVAKALGRPVDYRLPNAFQAVADAQTRGVPLAANPGAQGVQPLIDAYSLMAIRLMGQRGFTPSGAMAITGDRNGRAGGLGRFFGKLRK